MFAFNHYFSFRNKREKDRSCQPCRRNVDNLFLVPMARILPMHLTLIVGLTSSGKSVGMLIGFLSLKTVLDVITHLVENRASRQPSDGGGEDPLAQVPTRIRDIGDVEAFVLATTRDKELTQCLVDVIDQVGRDGYIAVERGGNGNPYEAEYQAQPEVPDPRKPSEIQAEYERLRQALASADCNTERDRIERRIAELAGGICTIRINVKSYDKFSRQKALIIDTWAKFRELVKKGN